MVGRVVSAKMNKTVVVLVERLAKHPLYKKTYTRSKKYLAQAEGVKEGDLVEIIKVRPISKNKHWKVVKVVGKDLAEIVEAEQKEAAEEVISKVMPEEKEEVAKEEIKEPEDKKEEKQQLKIKKEKK